MIFHQHIETKDGEIWVVDSSENGYVKSNDESRQEFEARVVKEMIQYIIGNVDLDHKSNGAPFIESQPEIHLSISHSDTWFVLYISRELAVGVDIEINSDQIKKTQSYFLSNTEIDQFSESCAKLQICWGIKEAIYKLFQGNLKSLKNEIEIISINNNRALAKVKSQEFQLNYFQTDIYTLVYTN